MLSLYKSIVCFFCCLQEDGDVSHKSNHFPDESVSSKLNSKGNNITSNGHDDDASTNTTISSPEPEEYTYDRAIQGYVNFTETRVKSRSSNHISRTVEEEENGNSNSNKVYPQKKSPKPAPKPRKDSIKVEEELCDLERIQARKFSGSASDLQNSEKKLNVPKVDILKRKELFERSESSDANEQSKIAPRAAGDLANSQSIKDRVSNLERQKSEENAEKAKQVKQLSTEISVKDRLSRLERQQSTENQTKSNSSSKLNTLTPHGDVTGHPPPSLKERLSSLEQIASQDRPAKVSTEITPSSIKSRLSELESSKESPKKVTPDRDPSFRDKLANFRSSEMDVDSQDFPKSANNAAADSPARFSSPDEDEFYQKRTFHRSLDSLDVDSSSLMSSEPYERVQSLEDLDSCGPSRNYPASASSNENLVFSSQSGDTDREDSGIHTADVSCSVSQADEPADLGDINVPCNNIHLDNGGNFASESERTVDYAPPLIVSQLAKVNLTETTPHQELSSRPNVVSQEATSPLHSPVSVDLPNSNSTSKSNASKSFSGQFSSLPTIPEVSHDFPPVVLVSDSEPVTPANHTDLAFTPVTASPPLETENAPPQCTDKPEAVNIISQSMVMVSGNIMLSPASPQEDFSCMSDDSQGKVSISCEESSYSSCQGSMAADGVVENNVEESVLVVTEHSVDIGTEPDKDKVSNEA